MLLPPNATALERAIDGATARIGNVPAPLAELWNPATCPAHLLPWLAWALSTDNWLSSWTEAEKRLQVAQAIELQRRKGTPASIDALLAKFDDLLELVEWFDTFPTGAPHTFEILLPLDALGGERSRAPFAREIVREVMRIKPVRSHFALVQSLKAAADVAVIGAARAHGFVRLVASVEIDASPSWARYLLTEDGEPLQDDAGDFLEDVA